MEFITSEDVWNQSILQFFLLTATLFCGIIFFKCLQMWLNFLRMARFIKKLPLCTRSDKFVYWILAYIVLLPYFIKQRKAPPITYIFNLLCGICKIYEKIGVIYLWILIRPLIIFSNPEAVEVILSSTTAIDKSREYKFLHPWLGSGLITSERSIWRRRRKLLTPAFHFRILEDFLPIINDQGKILTSKMANLSKEEWVDVEKLIRKCTLDVISETAMGVCINAQEEKENKYAEAMHGLGEIAVYRSLFAYLSLDFLFNLLPTGRKFHKNLNVIHKFVKKVIKEKRTLYLKQVDEKLSENEKTKEKVLEVVQNKRKPFLELLLDLHFQDPSFTEKDILDEVHTFMFAGHDTTTVGISWTLYLIGTYPKVQDEILKEIDYIFDGDNERHVTLDDTKDMKFLDRVIKESMRLYPPVSLFTREIKEDLVVGDYTVPVGCCAIIVPWIIHRNSEVYPNPEVFNPDRFLPENCIGKNPYAYIPFSAGPRNCIGQRFALIEEKILIIHILRKFTVKALDQRDKVDIAPDLVTRPVKPLRIKLIPREKEN